MAKIKHIQTVIYTMALSGSLLDSAMRNRIAHGQHEDTQNTLLYLYLCQCCRMPTELKVAQVDIPLINVELEQHNGRKMALEHLLRPTTASIVNLNNTI